MGCLLAENEPKQKSQVSNTQRVDFSGNALRIENSTGDLMVQGWDRPEVEIATIKSGRGVFDLDRVTIAVDRRGDELVIKTGFPRRKIMSPPWRSEGGFDLEYSIRVPRNVRLTVVHNAGEVHVEEISGDISVTSRRGEITLRVPNEGQYAIDASSKLGDVISDFPGQGKNLRPWLAGHQFLSAATSGQKLYLRIGCGDIIVWKTMRLPPSTSALR